MKYHHPLIFLPLLTLGLVACGGGGGGGSKPGSSAPATSVPATVSSSSVATSLPASSVPASSVPASSIPTVSSSSSSLAPIVITFDLTTGWRGNGTNNAGITYGTDGVAFNAGAKRADSDPQVNNVGAVTDLAQPTAAKLEDAVITMVVSVSPEFKNSGADLQIFAQIKGDWSKGEWNCISANSTLTTNTDVTLTCRIDEDDNKFDQAVNDVQLGIQTYGTAPAGVVTIKSATVTLAATSSSSSSSGPAYSANVDSLRELAEFPIGAAVSNTDAPTFNILTSPLEQAVVEKHFDQMTAGNIMKMKYLQPTQGNFTFANADAFVDYAKSKNMTVHGHSLVWHSDYQVPDFMKNWSGSSADFLTALDSHVTTIVDHFETKNNVVSWDVVNEALNDSTPSDFRADSPFYVKSGNSAIYIERAFQAARAAAPEATLYYNDYNIDQNNAKTTKLIEMLTDFQARNIPIDGVGFQMHVFMDYPSIANITAAMKKVVDKGLMVKITELDVSVNNPYGGWPASKIPTFTQAAAFAQKKRYCDIVKAYIDTVPAPQRGGISVWGTTDANTWLNDLYKTQFNNEKISWPLLFDNNYNDKPALRGFADGLQNIACTNQQ